MAVNWRTHTESHIGYVEYAEAEDGPMFTKRTQRLMAVTTRLSGALGPALYHSAHLSGLKPKTMYTYRVGDGVHWTEWNQFTTAFNGFAPFEFVYFGDAQNDVKMMWSRVIRQAHRDAPQAAFMLHAGDLINKANSDAEWGQWFEAGSHIHRMIPCLATPGNHEYEKSRLSIHWCPTFSLPENGPTELKETSYWIDYQGTRIVSLNSNEQQEEQVPWLEQVLRENNNRWTLVTFHHPIYSSAKGRDNTKLRELWQPLFDRFQVDLVLQGHDHTYARTQKLTANVPTGVTHADQAGTVYVVSVSGPKMYKVSRRPYMARVAEETQLYQIIRVEENELHYEAHTATGRLYDAFTLRKRPGRTNELLNRIPDTPERRRSEE
jgi:3',5'-cyclic AMP phosphodiesterase CpdA